jgi:superfamily II DNA or RNA helicase
LYFRVRDRERVLGNLHKKLFGEDDPWGLRFRKKDLMLAGSFPECETFVELWDIPEVSPGWLIPLLGEIEDEAMADESKYDGNPPRAITAIRERQKSELMKVPALLEEIEDLLEAGEHPVVFVQYGRTLKAIMSKVKSKFALIAGSWTNRKAEDEMKKFQSGAVPLVLCQTDAASESIDLHDTSGDRPRHVIIFPTYKAVTLIQVHGRTVRSGGKSPVVQRLVYSSGGLEEKISRIVERRLENLSQLMDGELTAGGML